MCTLHRQPLLSPRYPVLAVTRNPSAPDGARGRHARGRTEGYSEEESRGDMRRACGLRCGLDHPNIVGPFLHDAPVRACPRSSCFLTCSVVF